MPDRPDLPGAGDRGRERAPQRPARPRPQPLQPDGPLLRPAVYLRREGPLHGQIAALRPARPHLHLQARGRVPGAPRRSATRRPSGPPTPSWTRARCCWSMPRVGARARASSASRKPGIGRIALESGAPIVPVAIHGSASGARLETAALPEGHGPVRRAPHLPGRASTEPRAPARGGGRGLRPGAGDVRAARGSRGAAA